MQALRTLCLLLALVLASALYGQGKILRADPAINQIVPPNAVVEKLAGGFAFTEGPVWMPDGSVLFSDIPNNAIQKWTPDGKVTLFIKPSGYDGTDAPPGAFIGSNGLTLDKQGRLIICEHGNGRVTRLEKDGRLTVLAARYQGKRLNSPNDAVYRSDGSLYFTDPPYGFVKQDEDPKKELKFNGIYRVTGVEGELEGFALEFLGERGRRTLWRPAGGKLQLLSTELTRPNGLGFSPDEKYLYVANSDAARKIWMRFEVKPDGTLAPGKVFFDVTARTEDGLPDGLKLDQKGNLYGTGPGGVWIISPEGKHLGAIQPPETPANCAWGEADGKTLYITARTSLYRIKLLISGIRP